MISQSEVFYAVLAYLAVINTVSAIVTIIDKRRAKKEQWRISEKTLIVIAVLGGSFFEYITMLLIRHKTQHTKFMIGLPLIIFFQIILTVLILVKFIIT